MKKLLLASACLLAFGATSASATPPDWAGSFGGSFGNVAGFPLWNADGAVQIPLNWNDLDIEADAGARGAGPVHEYDGGGNIVWNGSNLRVAGTVIYNKLIISHGSLNETQFGGGAEWYATPWLTISGQGGGLAGTGSGGYVGGSVKGYVMPDLSIAGLVDYASLSFSGNNAHETDYGAQAEWLPIEEFPVSVTAEYEHADVGFLGFNGGTDIWTIGLKLNLNAAGAVPLVEHNRTGTLDSIGEGVRFHF